MACDRRGMMPSMLAIGICRRRQIQPFLNSPQARSAFSSRQNDEVPERSGSSLLSIQGKSRPYSLATRSLKPSGDAIIREFIRAVQTISQLHAALRSISEPQLTSLRVAGACSRHFRLFHSDHRLQICNVELREVNCHVSLSKENVEFVCDQLAKYTQECLR